MQNFSTGGRSCGRSWIRFPHTPLSEVLGVLAQLAERPLRILFLTFGKLILLLRMRPVDDGAINTGRTAVYVSEASSVTARARARDSSFFWGFGSFGVSNRVPFCCKYVQYTLLYVVVNVSCCSSTHDGDVLPKVQALL